MNPIFIFLFLPVAVNSGNNLQSAGLQVASSFVFISIDLELIHMLMFDWDISLVRLKYIMLLFQALNALGPRINTSSQMSTPLQVIVTDFNKRGLLTIKTSPPNQQSRAWVIGSAATFFGWIAMGAAHALAPLTIVALLDITQAIIFLFCFVYLHDVLTFWIPRRIPNLIYCLVFTVLILQNKFKKSPSNNI